MEAKKIKISKKSVIDFLEENVKNQIIENQLYYFVGAKENGEVYESGILISSQSWTNYPGIKICEWHDGMNYSEKEAVYKLFSEVGDEQAAEILGIEVPEEWGNMEETDKTEWVMENVDPEIVTSQADYIWEDQTLPAILDEIDLEIEKANIWDDSNIWILVDDVD